MSNSCERCESIVDVDSVYIDALDTKYDLCRECKKEAEYRIRTTEEYKQLRTLCAIYDVKMERACKYDPSGAEQDIADLASMIVDAEVDLAKVYHEWLKNKD